MGEEGNRGRVLTGLPSCRVLSVTLLLGIGNEGHVGIDAPGVGGRRRGRDPHPQPAFSGPNWEKKAQPVSSRSLRGQTAPQDREGSRGAGPTAWRGGACCRRRTPREGRKGGRIAQKSLLQSHPRGGGQVPGYTEVPPPASCVLRVPEIASEEPQGRAGSDGSPGPARGVRGWRVSVVWPRAPAQSLPVSSRTMTSPGTSAN